MSPTELASAELIVVLATFVLAFLFGAVALQSNFCTMGAISDVVNFGSWKRMRMWLLAMAVAISGSWGLQAAGLVDLKQSIYTGSQLLWLSSIVGGLFFGIGMTLAGGCGAKTIIRIGGGNLRSAVVFVVMGISAAMTIRGLFAVWRVAGVDRATVDLSSPGHQDLGSLLGSGLAQGGSAVAWVVAALLLIFVFSNREFWRAHKEILGGAVIGAIIVGGWYVTGHLGFLSEHPDTLSPAWLRTNSGRPESFSYTAPAAYSLNMLMMWTDASQKVTFGIASVLGMLTGALAMSLVSRSFRWEGFASIEELVNHLVGGLLMGFGGVTALGCTIGQGLTGISTLAAGSFITFFSIVGGCVMTNKYLEWRA